MDLAPTKQLKEGILVKKSYRSKRWKSRWVVLKENKVSFYRNRDKSANLGSLKLRGASVVCPAPEYTGSRKGVFRLSTRNGTDYLLQAQSDDDRGLWVHSISAIIRSLHSHVEKEDSQKSGSLPSNFNLSDILGSMQDPDAGVELATAVVDDVRYNNGFSGCTMINWLMYWSFASTRSGAQKLADELLRLAHIQPLLGGKAHHRELVNGGFQDSQNAFYRFSSLYREPATESGSESGSSSEGELSEEDILDSDRQRKGRVVKQGFLLKRSYLRKRWKVRKVILKDSPPCLEYYSAAKGADSPLKTFQLEGVTVHDLQADAADGPVTGSKKPKFALKRAGEEAMVFQAEDVYQKEEWLGCFYRVCGDKTQN